jgi:mevalonate kinase
VYPAKLLLFGEYATLVDAPALAMPVAGYGAAWAQVPNGNQQPLHELCAYLDKLQKNGELLCQIDIKQFLNWLSQNYELTSNIPQGYGLGSSGTVAAAVYDRFCTDRTTNLAALKQILAQIEAHFHGTSSGIDPLVSYVQQPLLIRSATDIAQVVVPPLPTGKFFLIDTALPRKTEQYVAIFHEKYKVTAFASWCADTLKPLTETCIAARLAADETTLHNALHTLSAAQYTHFAPMIPASMRPFWELGLAQKKFTIKLCGAGGGGFLLGYTTDTAVLPDALRQISEIL